MRTIALLILLMTALPVYPSFVWGGRAGAPPTWPDQAGELESETPTPSEDDQLDLGEPTPSEPEIDPAE